MRADNQLVDGYEGTEYALPEAGVSVLAKSKVFSNEAGYVVWL